MARQPSPVQRVLTLLDPLLGCPTTIVETHHSFGASRHIVTMKPTRGNSSPLCHSTLATTRRVRSQLPARYQSRRIGSPDASAALPTGLPEQRGDLPLQHLVAGESYSVKDVPLLEVLIDVRLGECGIGTKVPPHSCRPVAGQDRIQYITPPVRAMYLPRTASIAPSQSPNWLNTNKG